MKRGRSTLTIMHLSPRTFLSSILLLMCVVLSGQNRIIGLDLLHQNDQAEVPFEVEQGFIIVKIWLNGVIPLRMIFDTGAENTICLLYTSPSPRDRTRSRMPSSA